MASISPNELVIRCYGHRMAGSRYVGVCVDLNLAVQADTPQMLREKMVEAIQSYIETVMDTDDRDSIPRLLLRKAPLNDWAIYYAISAICFIKELPDKFFRFKEHLPFRLSHS